MSHIRGGKAAEFLPEIRCGACSRKLGEGRFEVLSIKCTRCKTVNLLRAESATPARHRAPQDHEAKHGKSTEKIDTRGAG